MTDSKRAASDDASATTPPLRIDLAAGESPRSTEPIIHQVTSPNDYEPQFIASYRQRLVVGLPLAAVALLVGLYWTILRRGAG